MSRKNYKPNRFVAKGSPQLEVERLLCDGRVKEAFKQAKILHNQTGSPEHHSLVERTYLARIQGLLQGGMAEGAREVATSLFEFGLTDSDVLQQLIPLLPPLGMVERALSLQEKLTTPEAQAALLLNIADTAVLHPANTPATMVELSQGAQTVRSALAALDAGEEARALELLQSISRSSPLADWRLLVRGLAAFRRQDMVQAQSNWERLDPQRAPHRIAKALESMSGSSGAAQEPKGLGVLETKQFGEPVLDRVGELQTAIESGKWNRALQLVGPIRQTLRRVNPEWAYRLTEIVLGPLANELRRHPFGDADKLCRNLMGALEPLPWDPKWNRFQAILWEGPQGSSGQAIEFWDSYIKDLEQVESVFGVESRRVRALVWRRIGSLTANAGDEEDDDDFDFDPDEEWEDVAGDAIPLAIEAYQESLKLDPSQRKTYEKLIELYQEEKNAEGELDTAQKLLAAFPEDVETMRRLTALHMQRDEPDQVLNYAARIRKLKPLDTQVLSDEVWAHLALARQLAIQGHWDAGRAHFSLVENAPPKELPPWRLLARKAAFEFKAGQTERAEEYVRQAEAFSSEKAPLWLYLSIETARYQVAKPVVKRFNDLFKGAVSKKVTSETAGALTEVLALYLVLKIKYTHRDGHVADVLAYLKRTTRIKYQESDLRKVCAFLRETGDGSPLFEKLSARGLKLFPMSPFFLFLAAHAEVAKGPFGSDLRLAKKQLEVALARAQSHEPDLVPKIKPLLSQLQNTQESMKTLPLPGGMGGPMPRNFASFLDMMAEELEAHGIDLNDLPSNPFGPFGPPRRPGKRKR